jgi:hypothetical protein
MVPGICGSVKTLLASHFLMQAADITVVLSGDDYGQPLGGIQSPSAKSASGP